MQLHIDYKPQPPLYDIHHQHNIMMLGSCFAENMAAYLQKYLFNVLPNPYGILFNPLSIATCINEVCGLESPLNAVHRTGVYYSYKCHSSVYASSEKELEEKFYDINKRTKEFICHADYLFISLGSAFVYVHTDFNEPVANCHKQASALFEKKLLTVEETACALKMAFEKLKLINPRLRIILTVSPVKYIKDGLENNTISKSVLHLAVRQLRDAGECDYFPAYELVNDDLRDYRFYKEDLAHPNEQALLYVWQKFGETYFADDTQALNKEIEKIIQAQNHRILFPESEAGLAFKQKVEKMKKELVNKRPYLKLY